MVARRWWRRWRWLRRRYGRSGRIGCGCVANLSAFRTCFQCDAAGDTRRDRAGCGPCGWPLTGCRRWSFGQPAPGGTSRRLSLCPRSSSWPWAGHRTSTPPLCNRSSALRRAASPEAGPCRRRQHATSSSNHLSCARYVGEQPLFEQAGGRPMRLQVRHIDHRIDHQRIRPAALGGELGENAIEHAEPAPADEPVLDHLVRTILGRRIPPPQNVADDKDNPRNHPPIVHPRNPVRQRK